MTAASWTKTTNSEAETISFGQSLAPLLQAADVIVLTGDLGAGKTHFTKGVAAGLGVQDDVTSPTFNILLVYDGDFLPLNHFDLYRLDDADELIDIDYAATLESDGVSLVEWGDKFPEAMPMDYLLVNIALVSGEERLVTITPEGPRSEELARVWKANQS